MKKYIAWVMLAASVSLTACGGSGGGEVRVVDYVPELYRFDVVDSYGVDTAKSTAPLAINPYLYNGLFDVFWQVNSLEDYQVNVRINDRPTVANSYLIYSEICGLGRPCDQDGGVICQYTSDLTFSCNADNNPTDIADLFQQIPQQLYLVLEVCDFNSSYCVYDYRRALME